MSITTCIRAGALGIVLLAVSPLLSSPHGGGMHGGGGGGGAHFSAPHYSAPHFSAPHYSAAHLSAPRNAAPHNSVPHNAAPRSAVPHYSVPPITRYSAPRNSLPNYSSRSLATPHNNLGTGSNLATRPIAPGNRSPAEHLAPRTQPQTAHRMGNVASPTPNRVVQRTWNDHDADDRQFHGHPRTVHFYSFTYGLPYGYLYHRSCLPGYYSYLYGAPYGYGSGSYFGNYGSYSVPYYGYGYRTPYYDNSYNPSYNDPADSSPAGAYPADSDTAAADTSDDRSAPSDTQSVADAELNVTEARQAFRDGKYFESVVLAGQAAQTKYDDPQLHEFLSLGMFALGDYRGAAIEAHAVIFYGHPAVWATIAGYYGDAAKYTDHLRALEAHVNGKPDDAAAVFLLGYHYLMLGHKELAITWLTKAVDLAPQDVQAKKLLYPLEGKEPPSDAAPDRSQPGTVITPKANGGASTPSNGSARNTPTPSDGPS